MAASSITIGDIEITGLSDATVDYPWPLDELFPGVPADTWNTYQQEFPATFAGPTTWRSDYNSYLLRSEGQLILVEAGMGPAEAPLANVFGSSGNLLQRLAALGVAPEDVDIVVLSHLHPDHVGWNLRREDDGYRLTFPQARYVVHQADWDAFHHPEVQAHFDFAFVEETISPLQQLGAVDLLQQDQQLTNDVLALHTPGHTPGHISLLVTSGTEQAILLGDILIHPLQVTEPQWNVMFDMDGDTARQTRQRLLDQIEANGMLVTARHFPEPGFGRIVRAEGRRYWQSVRPADHRA